MGRARFPSRTLMRESPDSRSREAHNGGQACVFPRMTKTTTANRPNPQTFSRVSASCWQSRSASPSSPNFWWASRTETAQVASQQSFKNGDDQQAQSRLRRQWQENRMFRRQQIQATSAVGVLPLPRSGPRTMGRQGHEVSCARGAASREANAGQVSLAQSKVMSGDRDLSHGCARRTRKTDRPALCVKETSEYRRPPI